LRGWPHRRAVIYKGGMKNGNGFEAAEAARHWQAGLCPAEGKQWLGTPRFIRIDSYTGPAERASDSPPVSSAREFGSQLTPAPSADDEITCPICLC
jgi:hypothetical protein